MKSCRFLLAACLAAAGQAAGQGPPPPYQIQFQELATLGPCCFRGEPSSFILRVKSYRPASTVHSVAVEGGKLQIELRNPDTYDAGIFEESWLLVDLPAVETAGSLPVEISLIDSPDDPEPEILAQAGPVVFAANPLAVLGVLPANPGPDDEIQVIANLRPSRPLSLIRGDNQHLRLIQAEPTTWIAAPEGWAIPVGRLPAGNWRIQIVSYTAAEIRVEVKDPTSDPGGPALLAGGFEVEAAWSTAAGEQGPARLVQPPSRDSALFYFFSADNWELMVKVLDGCAINNHYWVFGAASTDVGYTIDIRRQNSAQTYHYENPIGRTAPAITDIQAFPCDPQADPGT